METEFVNFNFSHFGIGLGIGMLITLLTWVNGMMTRFNLKRQTGTLKESLHTQMQINARGNSELASELEKLKKENENLRISIATLSAKPGRAELKKLHVWDTAIGLMNSKWPAFGPAWAEAIAESNQELEEVDTGVRALVKRAFAVLPEGRETPEE
ncbi:MAG: hypothetical protein AAFY11_05125 [Cyanobacteria bacterium J06641_5]